MKTYSFLLTLEAPVLDASVVNALFEAGCSDMTFSSDGSDLAIADVSREASSLPEAVLSAITDIERVPGLQVLRVE